jgi:hypothetical protein
MPGTLISDIGSDIADVCHRAHTGRNWLVSWIMLEPCSLVRSPPGWKTLVRYNDSRVASQSGKNFDGRQIGCTDPDINLHSRGNLIVHRKEEVWKQLQVNRKSGRIHCAK